MPRKQQTWTVTQDNTLKLIAADPRIREDKIGRAVMFGLAVMLKRGVPATRVLKFCELTIQLWKANYNGTSRFS